MPLIRTGPHFRIDNDPMQKRQRYGSYRRSEAARRIQTSYRRYRGASSTDQRQLRSVLRSHRAAHPYQIKVTSGRTMSFWRQCQVNISLVQGTGWQGSGAANINWGFALGNVFGFRNGTFQYLIPVPNASEFQALFDYYMIKNVKMTMFFSKTDADFSVGASVAMPILHICNDFDDIAESMTVDSMMQRLGNRTVQFDSANTSGIRHYVKPTISSVVVQTDVSTGAVSSSNSGIPTGSSWLDVAQSNIVHNGIKVVYNTQGRTASTEIGTVTFIFDIEYCFKGYR